MNTTRPLVLTFAIVACGKPAVSADSDSEPESSPSQEIDYETNEKTDYPRLDLRNAGPADLPLIGATGMVLYVEDEINYTDLDRQAPTAQFRLCPHCSEGPKPPRCFRYNCKANDDSFNQHRNDSFVANTVA
ncbi:MAG TPA: hypothetical protein VK034_30320, partial [Enhygromyxa sp.]|nr:hypothetical protein [Enhygromyxa sp.]